eukprot:763318-Hanusia_phi.AAC.18
MHRLKANHCPLNPYLPCAMPQDVQVSRRTEAAVGARGIEDVTGFAANCDQTIAPLQDRHRAFSDANLEEDLDSCSLRGSHDC